MHVQILDIDYITTDDGPVLRIFGKSKDGKAVCIFYHGFLPYFYAEGLGRYEKELRTEPCEKGVVGEGKKRLYRITLKNPADTPVWREKLRQEGIKSYEADILFKYRFMADLGLSGFGWVEVSGDPVQTKIVPLSCIKAKKLVPVEIDENVELKKLAFDIECISETGNVPDPKKDPVILISMAFSPPFQGKTALVLSTRQGRGVEFCRDEKEMLETFLKILRDFDPDILTGYNCNNFDLPYLLDRMAKYGIKAYFGRCDQKPATARKVGTRYRITLPGRIVADTYEIVKKDFLLQRYDLDFVGKTLLGEGKKEILRLKKIREYWRGDDERFSRLVEYSRFDSVLALKLLEKLDLLGKYIALSRVSGILLQDALEGGESQRIENFLLREFNKRGYVLPCKPEGEYRTEGLEGGEVLEPVKGLHTNVAVFDFKSMYPSIIKAFNICPTTLDPNGEIETPSGARFLSPEKREGIIPKIVERLMKERQEVKKKLKAEENEEKRRVLDAKQWALKILANAFYGYFGYSRSRLFNLEIANAITSCGRDIILKSKKKVEELYGFRVIYGDTDSLFVEIPEKDLKRIFEIGERVAKELTQRLPKGIELEFEKVFIRFLPLTKKRYAGLAVVPKGDGWEEKIETKGIETVRRDWCPLVEKTLKSVLEILFKKNDIKQAVSCFKEVAEKLLKGEIAISDLIITKTVTKSPKSYAGIQPHIEVIKKIQKRGGEAPGIGDRVGYVIVKGTQNVSKRAEDPAWVEEKRIPIDPQYYIENQLLPPLERLFSALGVSKSELLGNGRQAGLMDILNGQKPDGFICLTCSRWWPRPPLIGRCECGGELAFSNGVKEIRLT